MAYDFPNKPEDQIGMLKKMSEEGIGWRDQWGAMWDRNVAVLRGELWPDKASKPLFLANLISPTVRRKSGLLVESKPGIDVKPTRDGLGTTADVLKRTINAIWDEQNASMSLETMSYFLAGFGSGFWKITWDKEANFGLGDICLEDIDPRLMIVDPNIRSAANLWKAQYLREDTVVPYAWVKKHFPKTADKVQPDLSIRFETNETHKVGWYGRLMERLKKQASAKDSAIPRIYLQTWWVADWSTDKNGDLIYPGGRRIYLTGDDVILNPNMDPEDKVYGQNNPYWDGLFPYVMLDNEPDLDHPWGHAEVEALRKLNEAYNSVGHMTTRTLIKNVPWIITDQGAMDTQTLQDIKDLEEVVVQKAPGRTVERTPPSQPTGTNIQFMDTIRQGIEMYAGLNDGALQGKGRVELRSGPQLEGLQQAAQVLIRSQARRLESMIQRAGQLLISRVFQFYTDDRIMTYIDNNEMKEYKFQKDQLKKEIVDMAAASVKERALKETNENLEEGMSLSKAVVDPVLEAEDIMEALHGSWKLFRFKVIPFSTLASTKMQRAMALEQLAQQGLIPGRMVVEEAGFDNAKELFAEAMKELQEKLAMGWQPPQPSGKGGGKKK